MNRSIITSDGHQVSYVYKQGENSDSSIVVLLLHGMFSNRSENGRYDRLTNKLNQAGFNTLGFDFRGHGESKFSTCKFSISGAITDLQAVIKALEEDGCEYVQLIASSFSGCTAILTQKISQKNMIASIAFLNPVVDFESTVLLAESKKDKPYFDSNIIDSIHLSGSGVLENGFVVSSQFYHELCFIKPYEFINDLKVPVIVFHGTADEKVDYKISKRYFSKVKNIKVFLIEEAAHGFKNAEKEKIVFDGLVEWVLDNSSSYSIEKKSTLKIL